MAILKFSSIQSIFYQNLKSSNYLLNYINDWTANVFDFRFDKNSQLIQKFLPIKKDTWIFKTSILISSYKNYFKVQIFFIFDYWIVYTFCLPDKIFKGFSYNWIKIKIFQVELLTFFLRKKLILKYGTPPERRFLKHGIFF